MGGGAAPGAGVGLVATGGGAAGVGGGVPAAGGRALATGGGGGGGAGFTSSLERAFASVSAGVGLAGSALLGACETAGGGRPRTAAAPLGVCNPSTTRVALSGSPGTARKASTRLSRKRSSLWVSISCGRSFWRRTTARRAVWTGAPSYLSSTWLSASAPALRLTRTALNAPLALLRSMLARPALASMSRVARVTQRSPQLWAWAAGARTCATLARQTKATSQRSIVRTPRVAIQDGNIDAYPQDNMLQTRNFYAQKCQSPRAALCPAE